MRALWIRLLQVIALFVPGSMSVRVWLHRRRGVHIGRDVFIGQQVLLETSMPELISVGDRVTIGIRDTIIAHFRSQTAAERGDPEARFSVVIADDVFLGPGVIVLPGVTIGRGAVVAAGSVVTGNVPELTLVQGNPARPVARCGIALSQRTSLSDFYRSLRPIRTDRRPASS